MTNINIPNSAAELIQRAGDLADRILELLRTEDELVGVVALENSLTHLLLRITDKLLHEGRMDDAKAIIVLTGELLNYGIKCVLSRTGIQDIHGRHGGRGCKIPGCSNNASRIRQAVYPF